MRVEMQWASGACSGHGRPFGLVIGKPRIIAVLWARWGPGGMTSCRRWLPYSWGWLHKANMGPDQAAPSIELYFNNLRLEWFPAWYQDLCCTLGAGILQDLRLWYGVDRTDDVAPHLVFYGLWRWNHWRITCRCPGDTCLFISLPFASQIWSAADPSRYSIRRLWRRGSFDGVLTAADGAGCARRQRQDKASCCADLGDEMGSDRSSCLRGTSTDAGHFRRAQGPALPFMRAQSSLELQRSSLPGVALNRADWSAGKRVAHGKINLINSFQYIDPEINTARCQCSPNY